MPNVEPSVLANAIMGKIYDVLTNGDATVPKPADSFFSWETPGVPVVAEDFEFMTQGFTGVVTPAAVKAMLAATQPAGGAASVSGAAGGSAPAPQGLTEAQLAQLRAQDLHGLFQQAESFARLVDFIPDCASINGRKFAQKAVQTNQGSLSDVYEMTLKMSQVMQSVIPDDVTKKIEHFRSLLTATTEKTDLITGDKIQVSGPSPLVQVYTEKMTAYDNAALAYNNARISAMAANDPQSVAYFSINAPILRNQVKAAMDDWIGAGYKNQYEEINAFIAQVEARDLSLLKKNYLDDLEKARLTGIDSGGDFFYTSLTPAHFATAGGWSKFHFRSGDFSSYANSKFNSSGWQASAGGGMLGIFGVGGSGSRSSSSNQFNSSFNSDHFSMSFDICQVGIVRDNWMKRSFLDSHTWRFDPGNPDLKDQVLSDGGSPPNGLLTAYAASIIFVCNLVLDFGDNSGFQNYLQQQDASNQGGAGGVSFGPFSLAASGSRWSRNTSTQSASGYSWTDQGLSVPGLQVAGYRCQVLRNPTPKPSPGITNWI
jgi:hypothetical protein